MTVHVRRVVVCVFALFIVGLLGYPAHAEARGSEVIDRYLAVAAQSSEALDELLSGTLMAGGFLTMTSVPSLTHATGFP
jgi:hypothetical protein